MVTVAVQFLEDSPELREITPHAVRHCLRKAFATLPVSILLVGWNLPAATLEAVVEETTRAHVRLYRWQPLLTGDGALFPRPEWQAIGIDGSPVKGFRGLPEFTFICPNKPAVQEAVRAHLQEVMLPPYQGVFLDRIRFPSPAPDPFSHLACFCDDCCRAAMDQAGLDLVELQRTLRAYDQAPGTARWLAAGLFGSFPPELPEAVAQALRLWFHFRSESIAQFTRMAAEIATSRGMEVGLDCFSPSLTWMVGQDLGALAQSCNWIKAMTYAHVLGPAGLPYEFLGLASFLQEQGGMNEQDCLAFLQELSGLPLPATLQSLRRHGLPSSALVAEIKRARDLGAGMLFSGLELVEMPGVVELNTDQIYRDWQAVLEAGVEGVVLSWDLWHMPLECLKLVSDILVKYS